LFFYPRDVVLAVHHGFKSTPDCEEWLQKIWRVLKGTSDQPKREEYIESKRREIIKKKKIKD
jgi:hypothetical protein